MRIGIDARMIGSGSGLGRYLQQLVFNLTELDNKNEYILFLRDQNHRSSFASYLLLPNYKIVTVNIPWYSWAEQVKLPSIIKREKVDLMHFPHWNVPLFYPDPFVVTIHDLIMFHYPRPRATTLGPVKFWAKDQAHRLVVRHAVESAEHILVPSEFTKQDVHKTLRVPLVKMTVAYQAPFTGKAKGTVAPAMGQPAESFLAEYHINRPYLLYVGAAYPHKNLAGLLKAWKIFVQKYGNDYQLVLVGKEDYFYRRFKDHLARGSCPPLFTGFVPDDKLSWLYQQADLYVAPSLYEGFGLPPLEAMAQGVPVVASNRTCLPEVLGGAALYFDPTNYEQMAAAIYLGLTDENIRLTLKEKARAQLRRYSSERLVKETLAVYRAAFLCYNKN